MVGTIAAIIGLIFAVAAFIFISFKAKQLPQQSLPPESNSGVPEDSRLAPTVYVNPGLLPDIEPPGMETRLCDHDPMDVVPLADGNALYFKSAPPRRSGLTLTVEVNQPGRPSRQQVFTQTIVKIGKLASSHVRLDDGQVSRMHAVIEVGADCAYIIDLGSTNGTFVNGGRINKCRLNHGDIVDVGNTRIVIRISPPKDVPDALPET